VVPPFIPAVFRFAEMTSNAGLCVACAALNAAMLLTAIASANALPLVLMRMYAPLELLLKSVAPTVSWWEGKSAGYGLATDQTTSCRSIP
jgi:hypothetical protein